MSQNSYSSQRKCSCDLVVKTLISSTISNPGRRFFRCPRPDFSSCGYWEWKDQAFPEVAYLRNLESSLKDVKMEMDNSKIEVDNLKIEMENLKIVVENLKIKVGHLSETIATLEASNDLVVEKVRTFQDKYHKIKYKVMISCFLFVGFLVALTIK
ncbi:hypothetical protein MTR67_038529 [Solanum verrucosum]|uniref:GRF-type domain-containing protein n=1 Tax=Solanum verrucosum TaxID=315347 RepID=A0AAF0UFZ4_SOLVR|nr:hypothetical protein MTR67_038529 [Solanum verrucosum]